MNEEDDNWYADGPCPKCGNKVTIEPDCPGFPSTYNGKETIMVCSPCSNATLYECVNDECGWWFRTPNRRGTTRNHWYDDENGKIASRPVEMGPAPTDWEAKDVMP